MHPSPQPADRPAPRMDWNAAWNRFSIATVIGIGLLLMLQTLIAWTTTMQIPVMPGFIGLVVVNSIAAIRVGRRAGAAST